MELEDVPVPQPGENELLVRIYAASVNPVDYKIRLGKVRATLDHVELIWLG